jgi:hypothetical protein
MSYVNQIVREQKKEKSIVTEMECGGFKASLMRAERLKGDYLHGLPPGSRVEVFPIAALPGCPEGWVRATGTYVCPVDISWGLWFDWTMNDRYNTAIIPSVKGMNPITGQKIDHIGMEQYRDKCPIHNTEFSHDRYCEKCNYKWPPQNYICYPDTLWWDGFRSPDGSVRQFFFTEDEKRDIASLVIGKENTVPAFGFVFYRTKNQRNITPPNENRGALFVSSQGCGEAWSNNIKYDIEYAVNSNHYNDSGSYTVGKKYKSSGPSGSACSTQSFSDILRSKDSVDNEIDDGLEREVKTSGNIALPTKEVSVGGGARINQSLTVDPLALDGWCEKEAALIRLYFVFEPQFREIVKKGGIKDISGTDTGYLSGLPLG